MSKQLVNINKFVVVFVFNFPSTAKKSLDLQTGEAGNRTYRPWFTWLAVYPLHQGAPISLQILLIADKSVLFSVNSAVFLFPKVC